MGLPVAQRTPSTRQAMTGSKFSIERAPSPITRSARGAAPLPKPQLTTDGGRRASTPCDHRSVSDAITKPQKAILRGPRDERQPPRQGRALPRPPPQVGGAPRHADRRGVASPRRTPPPRRAGPRAP